MRIFRCFLHLIAVLICCLFTFTTAFAADTSCADGYHYKEGQAGLNVDASIAGTGYAAIGNDGNQDATNGGKTQSDYNLTANGTWGTSFSYGDITGKARCATNRTENYNEIGTPEGTEGKYCWCQIDGFTPTNGSKQSLSGAWVFHHDVGNADGCADVCAGRCANNLQYVDAFRAALLGSVSASPAICEADTYTITYELNGGTNYANAPTTYTIETAITLSEPTKDGYTFAGWVDDNGNTITEIPLGSTGNITLSAQWTQDTPSAEFTITTTEMAAGTVFKFYMSAAGEFTVDWGDGNVETITRTNTTDAEYTHTYTNAGTYTIGFSGQATGYASSVSGYYSVGIPYHGAAISFFNNKNVAGISGSLGAIFGTLSSGTNIQPRFYYTFFGNTNLTGSIPHDLFAGISGSPASYMFGRTFNGCSGLSGEIPHDLFAGISGAPADRMFDSTFYGCRGLTGSIPHDLFAGISGSPASFMFYSTFYGCRGLTGEIPHDLFAGISGSPASAMFYSTFSGCSNLTGSIPHDLFAGISGSPASAMFSNTFWGCSGLSGEIPHDLFTGISGAPASSMFASTFSNCSGLTGFKDSDGNITNYIPNDYMSKINSTNYTSGPMRGMFSGTGILTSCPENMYRYETPFDSDFYGTSGKVSCAPCPKGTTSPVGSTSIEQCVVPTADIIYNYVNGGSGCANETYTLGSAKELTCVPTRNGYTFEGWYDAATGGNKITQITALDTGDKTLYAQWTANSITCPAGTYLPANATNATQCTECPINSYCTGGDFTFDETNTGGVTSCPSGYSLSAGGSVSADDCYRQCTYNDVAHSKSTGTLTGMYYSNNTNACEPVNDASCADGYHYKAGSTGLNVDASINATDYGYQNDSTGRYGAVSYNTGTYGITADQTWATEFSYGVVRGKSICSTTKGKGLWMSGADKANSPEEVTVLPDGTFASDSTGQYCWCQIDGFTPTNGSKQSLSGAWVYHGDDDAVNCALDCAYYCAFYLQNSVAFRAALLGTVSASPAICEANTYTITYELNGGTNNPVNPTNYTIETATITLNTPTRTGYTFNGWYRTSDFSGSAITGISQGSTGNKTLYAKWTPTEYTITYDLGGGTNDPVNPTSYTIETATITLNTPTRTGYTFNGWYTTSDFSGSAVTGISQGSTGNKTLYTKWTALEYNIRYDLGGGTNYENAPTSYTIESSITLNTPTRSGYTFNGWIDDNNNQITSIPTGLTGDKTFYAQWTPIECQSGYELRTVPSAGLDLDSAILASSSSGNTTENTWTATVSGTSLSGISSCAANSNGSSGDILSEPINTENASDNLYCYCKLSEPAESSWVLAWKYSKATGTSGCPVKCANQCAYLMKNKNDSGGRSTTYFREALYSTASTGEQTVCEPISYTITYDLGGGTNNSGNPASYTIESATITLSDPTKTGYTFNGWTDDNSNQITSIPTGSTGNKTFYAQWSPIEYTITYELNGGTNNSANPVKYTIESETIILNTPTKQGYIFDGWIDDNDNTITEITTGSAGDIILTARWKELECQSGYEVHIIPGTGLDLDSSILASSSSGNNSANTWTAIVSGTSLSGISSCAANSTRTIDYNYATGVSGDILNEPINTENTSDNLYCYCKLIEPEESSWVFAWRYSQAAGASGCLTKCANQCAYLMKNKNDSSGERSTAYFRESLYSTTNRQTTCDPISYTITYDLNAQGSVVENDNPASYTVESLPILLNSPSRENFNFAGWKDANGNLITSIPTGSTGNITLTAQWDIAVVHCDAGYYLPADSTECQPCEYHQGIYCDAGDYVVSNRDQGILNCPIPDNITGAFFINYDQSIDFNGNGVRDSVEECTIMIMQTEYDESFWGEAAIDGYDSTNKFNKNIAQQYIYCRYNLDTNSYKCIPNTENLMICTGGYYIPETTLASNSEICNFSDTMDDEKCYNTDLANMTNPCIPAQPGYYTTGYDRYDKGVLDQIGLEIFNRMHGFGGMVLFNEYFNIVDNMPETFDAQYTLCPQEYPNSDAGAWTINMCYRTCPSKDGYTLVSEDREYYNETNKCEYVANTYSITYELNGGSGCANDTYTLGTTKELSCVPTRNGYTFAGWYDASTGGNKITQITALDTDNKTFYAQWTIAVVHCDAGYYLPANSIECQLCSENHYCDGGDYIISAEQDAGIELCPDGVMSPEGTSGANGCGKILHVGDNIIYLTTVQETTPALAVRLENEVYYARTTPVSEGAKPMNKDTTESLRVKIDGIEYSIHDNTIKGEQ